MIDQCFNYISTDLEIILDATEYFDKYRNVRKLEVITALAALAQDHRLEAYRLLVQAGPDGMPAGEVAAAIGLPPQTLTFHFDKLREAGLVTVQRNGRLMIYAARYDIMNALIGYLTENCCSGRQCSPTARKSPSLSARRKEKVA